MNGGIQAWKIAYNVEGRQWRYHNKDNDEYQNQVNEKRDVNCIHLKVIALRACDADHYSTQLPLVSCRSSSRLTSRITDAEASVSRARDRRIERMNWKYIKMAGMATLRPSAVGRKPAAIS